MLFTERAAAASGTFELTAANQAAVVGSVRRLDGLPLAIELAAVRTRVLTVEQILDRLADRFGLLTGGSRAALPRHQTLRTTIEWSHDLLTEGERAVLRRRCVFAGRFTLEDVESVCSAAGRRALDVLSSLVDKSLVIKEDAGGLACYRLHETMRDLPASSCARQARSMPSSSAAREYYRATCLQSALEGRYRLLDWLAWADLEIDNIRAVLRRCLTGGDAARGVELAASLGWFWITRATTEGIRWLDAFLALAEKRGNTDGRGWALFHAWLPRRAEGGSGGFPAGAARGGDPGQAKPGSGNCWPKRSPWPRSRRTWPASTTPPGVLIGEADVAARARGPLLSIREGRRAPGPDAAGVLRR